MVSTVFTGDVAFSGYFKDKYNSDIIDRRVKEFLTSADHVVANVECVVTDNNDGREFRHTSPEASVDFFRSIGANIWCLGNNHSFDLGAGGVKNTLSVAAKNDIRTIGAGKTDDIAAPLVIGENEVAIISVTYEKRIMNDNGTGYGTLFWKDEKLKKIIADAKNTCRWCIVVAHCGDEFSPIPLPYIRKQYRRYLEYGADVVVGHHPHVVQNYETVGEKVIFYSLGNFVFDTNYQRSQCHTDLGVLLKICFGESAITWDHIAVRIERDTGNICNTDDIAVFRDIGQKEYDKYWPLAAKVLEKNQIKVREYLHGSRDIMTKLKYAAKRYTHLRYDFGRDIFIGSIHSKFKKYDKDSILYKYIIGS